MLVSTLLCMCVYSVVHNNILMIRVLQCILVQFISYEYSIFSFKLTVYILPLLPMWNSEFDFKAKYVGSWFDHQCDVKVWNLLIWAHEVGFVQPLAYKQGNVVLVNGYPFLSESKRFHSGHLTLSNPFPLHPWALQIHYSSGLFCIVLTYLIPREKTYTNSVLLCDYLYSS